MKGRRHPAADGCADAQERDLAEADLTRPSRQNYERDRDHGVDQDHPEQVDPTLRKDQRRHARGRDERGGEDPRHPADLG